MLVDVAELGDRLLELSVTGHELGGVREDLQRLQHLVGLSPGEFAQGALGEVVREFDADPGLAGGYACDPWHIESPFPLEAECQPQRHSVDMYDGPGFDGVTAGVRAGRRLRSIA